MWMLWITHWDVSGEMQTTKLEYNSYSDARIQMEALKVDGWLADRETDYQFWLFPAGIIACRLFNSDTINLDDNGHKHVVGGM